MRADAALFPAAPVVGAEHDWRGLSQHRANTDCHCGDRHAGNRLVFAGAAALGADQRMFHWPGSAIVFAASSCIGQRVKRSRTFLCYAIDVKQKPGLLRRLGFCHASPEMAVGLRKPISVGSWSVSAGGESVLDGMDTPLVPMAKAGFANDSVVARKFWLWGPAE